MQQSSVEGPPKRDSGVRSIVALYLGFFAMWCAGLAIGEMWPGPEQPVLLGMPLWFFVSCLFAFAAVSIALILCVRRYFQ